MKAETIHQTIDFVLGTPKCQAYISSFESAPQDFAIYQIGANVLDYNQSIVRVYINFKERTPTGQPEDVLVDVQGTYYGDFQVLKVIPTHLAP